MYSDWKKHIILFLVSQTVSLFGSALVQYAIFWYVTLTTQSGEMMTIYIICGILPTFFLSPFAGVWADRYNRKMLIVISDSVIAAATLVLAILFLLGYHMLWLLSLISGIRALGTAIQVPAVGAYIPQLVPQEELTRVNAANGTIQALVMLISPMLSGALLTVTNIELIFFIDVATAIIGVSILLIFLQVPAHAKALEKHAMGYLSDLFEGFRYIYKHEYVKKLFLLCTLYFFLVAPVAFLTPLQVTRTFGGEVWRLTLVEVAYSAGMMLGGIIMAYWQGFSNKVHSMAFSILSIGVCTFVLGIIPYFYIYLVFMALAGIVAPIFHTPFTVLLQQRVETDLLGRVFGVLGMISSTMMPLGMLFFGPLADLIAIEWLLIGTGILIITEGCCLLGSKVLIEAGKPILQQADEV
jgi:Arabinose efflux permease